MAVLRFTILGCGSSGGVPRLGGDWGDCDPSNPRNRRRRCSVLVERVNGTNITRVLIDTPADMREQLLSAGVGTLDAVVYTHGHADHLHGIDDLRQIVFNRRARLPVWADAPMQATLRERFSYVFDQPAGSPYPPILDLHLIDGPVRIDGPGGVIEFIPFATDHGNMPTLGFRVGTLAYMPDAVGIPDASRPALTQLDVLIVDALRRKPHPTHAHLDMTLGWIADLAPARAVLTNLHNDLDYATLDAETPPHVTPAFDGMVIEMPAP